MFHNGEEVLLVASVILFLSIFAGKAGYRFGLPALLLFLGVGMLFGSDGCGAFACCAVLRRAGQYASDTAAAVHAGAVSVLHMGAAECAVFR